MKIFMRVLWILGLVAWTVCFALGFNYGENSSSFLVSVLVFVAVLGVMATDLIILHNQIDPDSVNDKSKARVKEIASLIVYFAMVGVTVVGVARFVTIQTQVKSEIAPLAKLAIDEVHAMFTIEENSTNSYLTYVDEMAERYRAYKAKGYHDKGTLDTYTADFIDQMKQNGLYRPIGIDDKIAEYDYRVLNWLPWNIAETLVELDTNPQKWAKSLTDLSESVLAEEWPEAVGDKYVPTVTVHYPSLYSRLTNYSQSNFGVLSIVLIVILQLMILIPYVWQKDWSVSGPVEYKSRTGRGPKVSK
ncbi:MAG: hypothetical protein IKV91_00355 [Bacteroidales bacterium]|nr:hypothetical protein [Bacteroidales bacterium]